MDYRIEPEDPTRTVPNPERRALDKQIRAAAMELAQLERQYGAAAADNTEQNRPTMRGFKIAYGKLGKQLRAARERLSKPTEKRHNTPSRLEIRDLSEPAVVKLATERKHPTDIIRVLAYQAESDLPSLLRPRYLRAEQEGRTLLHELFATAGDIKVSDSELQITLDCTTRSDKTHITETHAVHYRCHPWYGRTVYVFTEVDKNNSTCFSCALESARTARPLEVPKWMFDATLCARCALQDSPAVPWETLRQLVELLTAADRFGDVAVVRDGHLDRLNPGGTHATPESPAGRSAQSVSSGSDLGVSGYAQCGE